MSQSVTQKRGRLSLQVSESARFDVDTDTTVHTTFFTIRILIYCCHIKATFRSHVTKPIIWILTDVNSENW